MKLPGPPPLQRENHHISCTRPPPRPPPGPNLPGYLPSFLSPSIHTTPPPEIVRRNLQHLCLCLFCTESVDVTLLNRNEPDAPPMVIATGLPLPWARARTPVGSW